VPALRGSKKNCPSRDAAIGGGEVARSPGLLQPGYRDCLDLQAVHRKRLQWALFAVAAGILLLIPVVGRILSLNHRGLPAAQSTAVIDLRDRSVTRGAEQGPAEGPLEVSRYASQWDIQLPLGSADRPYEVRLTTPQGQQVFAARGVATISGGITLLRVEVSLSSASPGPYVLSSESRHSLGIHMR